MGAWRYRTPKHTVGTLRLSCGDAPFICVQPAPAGCGGWWYSVTMEDMETRVPETEHAQVLEKWHAPLTSVTPLSRYLAMALFVALPFLGFWLGVGWGNMTMTERHGAEKLNLDTAGAPSSETVTFSLDRSVETQEAYSGTFATKLVVDGERYEVALIADNLTTERTTDSFCGHDAGVLMRSGSFRLVSRKDDREVGSVVVDHVRWFAEGQLHDGIRLIQEPRSGITLIGIYQYESCSTESLALYHLARNGELTKVPFLQEDGHVEAYPIGTSHAGVEQVPEGLRGCVYSNANFTTYCSTYNFTGSVMQRVNYEVSTR